MEIRRLQPADAASYAELRREMLHDSPWAFAASPTDDRGVDPDRVRATLADPAHAIVGAWTPEGRLVSVAGVHRNGHTKMAHRVHIWGVYTTPAARGQGACFLVLQELLRLATTWPGVTSAGLSVSIRSPGALALYRKLGFRAWGTEPGALMIDGVAYDEVHMVTDLPLTIEVEHGQTRGQSIKNQVPRLPN
jgi:RimJ/RimL family protein N-acetyltransferase